MNRTGYDKSFFQYYDVVDGSQTDFFNELEKTIFSFNNSPKSILEIACGTGNLISSFKGNLRLAGIDYSPKMLSAAQAKYNNVDFYNKDMRDFSLSDEYDVIFCARNSLNHLSNISEIELFFKCVERHLSPNGFFILDFMTLKSIQHLSSIEPIREIELDNVLIKQKVVGDDNHLKILINIKNKKTMEENNDIINLFGYNKKEIEFTLDDFFSKNKNVPVHRKDYKRYVCSQ